MCVGKGVFGGIGTERADAEGDSYNIKSPLVGGLFIDIRTDLFFGDRYWCTGQITDHIN